MEPLAVDDDICILKHETAYTAAGESPVSVCAGDESVASHFALVTAYEDIKKRLRDTERENTLLRRRVKQLEDKLFRPEAPPSEGPQYVNKAFSAYRGIYIEKEDLQMELNKLKKEKSESERLLMEQLQAKELELLQLKTEMETSQVMKSLNSSQDYWQMDRVSSEHKIDKLQEELERMTVENNRLLERGVHSTNSNTCLIQQKKKDSLLDFLKQRSMQKMYEALCSEVTHLQAGLKHQTGLIQKLRPLLHDTKQEAASTVPVQCLDDVEKNNNLTVPRVSLPRPPSAPPLPSSCGRPPPPQNQASLDDSSRSFPSPPKPSDAMFWEGHFT
uniref:5-azacytidine induced 2 n=1 Tax=Tetraodon nigroviridis TaxID=99883 RepID=H3DP63_TETNG